MVIPPSQTPSEQPPSAPTTPPTIPTGPGRLTIGGLLLLYGIIVLWCGGQRDFWGEEAASALTTREMESSLSTATGWLSPTRAGEPWLEHPPLLPWLGAIFARLSGASPLFAYRIPIALAAILGLWVTYDLTRRLLDGRAALLAMALQATSGLYFFAASWFGPDLLFAVLCHGAIAGFALTGTGRGGRGHRILGWLALAGACLVKSAILATALVFFALSLFFFFAGGLVEVKRGLSRLFRGGFWVLLLVLTAPWYTFAAVTRTGAFVDQHLIGLHVSPLFGSDPGRPAWYYLPVLLLGFLPWTVFLPHAFFLAKDRLARPAARLGFFWFLFTFVAFSLVSGKSAFFLLFGWPALAILVPAGIYAKGDQHSVWEDYLRSLARVLLPHVLRVPLILVLITLALWLAGVQEKSDALGVLSVLKDGKTAGILFGVLGAASAACFFLARRIDKKLTERNEPVALFEASRATLLLLLAAAFVLPALDPRVSLRSFVQRAEEKAAGHPLATYGRERPAAVYYFLESSVDYFGEPTLLARKKSEEDEARRRLLDFVKASEEVYLIASHSDMASLRIQFSEFKANIHETDVHSGEITGEEYVLYTNRPEPAAPGT